jgi:hypothetical protein
MAVDKVVFGPGVKLLTVASTNKALSSEGVMVMNVGPSGDLSGRRFDTERPLQRADSTSQRSMAANNKSSI